jgi:ABC-type transport system substrate-binding protein/class 3 adenylate cyclase/streptogramin lyase/tRNA A-37 threonylcarbamoyl transferase component Bud32
MGDEREHSSPVTDLSTGQAISGYRIEAVLGRGSMGTVYSALDVALERRVALKVITPELSRDERFRDRFLRESKLAASLEHPHIVPIHAAGEADGLLYLAMRYVEGRDLGALLRGLGRLDPERALAILGQVASALDVAHARGLVHRDVKPANIMLTHHGAREDYAYLCDFGLAKHTSTVSSLTGSRAIVGTVDYLAPEQIEGRPVDGRVDVYALGCVLYECLTGEPPYQRGNELASLLAHVNDPIPSLSERRLELPEALDAVVATALAKDRDERYATCAELVEAAAAALRGEAPAVPAPRPVAAPGIRTFVIADVRGYTTYTREHGDEAGAELARKFAAIVERLAPEQGGALQELRGDEALVVFDSPRRALRFAIELQRAVEEEQLGRPVGVGLDAGEAVPVEDGFRGGALNRAARLCALAAPGEVLASDAVRELAGATEGVAFGFRRVERLKGFDKPIGVVEVHAADRAPGRDLSRQLGRALGGSRPRLRLAVAGLAAIVAAGVAIPLALLSGGSTAEASPLKQGAIGLLDARTLKPVGSFDQAGVPDGIWTDPDGQLWTIDASSGSAARIDPKTRKVTLRFPLQVDSGLPAWGAGSFWMGDDSHASVVRYDLHYGTIVKRIALPTKALQYPDITVGMAYGAGSIWAAYGKYPFRIARIDPATNRVVKTIDLSNALGQALLSFAGGNLWVVSQDTGRVWRIDPTTYRVAVTAKLHGGWVEDLRVVGGYAWLPVENDRAVWKLDRSGNILKSIPTGDLPYALADDGRGLFVVNQKSATISRIDTASDEVTTVRIGHRAKGIAVAAGLVWVPLEQSVGDATVGLESKKVLRVVAQGDPLYNTDPVLAEGPAQTQLQQAIGARLLRFPDREQPSGATLEPEIADLPTISNRGRTYTFRIQSGYTFSPPSGEAVTAETMRYTIERALSPRITDPSAQAFNLVQDIVGLDAYRARKAAHISGLEVDGDRLSITLRRPAPDFPARIALPFFSAVPLGTPALAHGVGQPIPSAGPYYLAAHIDDLAEVIKRNPHYKGPRPHELDAFVYDDALEVSAGALRVSRNQADYVFGDRPPYPDELQPTSRLARRYGEGSPAAKAGQQRYFLPAASAVNMLSFNTSRGPFRDPSLRKAVNYALDRRALAGVTTSQPAESILPPGVPGAGGPAIYPLDRSDLAKARALMHGRHVKAVLYSGSPDGCSRCAETAERVVQDLGAIGIDVQVKLFDDRFGEAGKPNAAWDLIAITWLMDFADPSDFVDALLVPGRNLGYAYPWPLARSAGPGWPERVRAAYAVAGPGRAAAYRRVVAAMFRAAPPVAVYGLQNAPPQLFSSRIGCQVFRPQDSGYVDLAALCLRQQS